MFAYKVGLALVDDADEDLKRSRFHERFKSSSMYKLFSDSGVSHSFRHVILAMHSEYLSQYTMIYGYLVVSLTNSYRF